MNWVDYVIIFILLIYIIDGLGQPFFDELFSLVSFILAFFVSLKYYNLASKPLENLFSLPHSLTNALGFLLVWYIFEVLFFLIVKIPLRGLKNITDIPEGRILSTIPAFFRGLIVVAILLILTITFPFQPGIKKDVNDSLIGSRILNQAYQLETPLKSVFGGLANDTLAFLTIHPQSSETVNLGFKTSEFTFNESLEYQMFALVNKERTSRGLPALEFDNRLRDVARSHSGDMFKRGYFSHYSPEGQDVVGRATENNISFLVIGENLAYAPSLELAHQGLMNSPGHRANILSPDYHRLGIGVAVSSTYGMIFTQNFTD